MKRTSHISTIRNTGAYVRASVVEALWPTRCAICEKPGVLLCDSCKGKLAYIDQNMSCPGCGAPFGFRQCTECNDVLLAEMEMASLPFESARNLVTFDERARRMVTSCKDKGEQRLAGVMGSLMANLVSPEQAQKAQAVTYIPASTAALRRRGFDHGLLISQALAGALGLPCLGLLSRPIAGDQRQLGRSARVRNMAQAFCANPHAAGRMPKAVILSDDVMTTGASAITACQVLKDAGVQQIYVVTFARAW